MDLRHRSAKIISAITTALGSGTAIALSVGIIILWLVSGPLFGFSDTWQLVINTGTTIITFIMVFIIQNTQNRDGRAIQTKLDKILEILCEDVEDLIALEDEPEKDIKAIQRKVHEEVHKE